MDIDKIEEIVQMSDESIRLYTAHLEFLRKTVGWSETAMKVFDDIIPDNDNSLFVEIKDMHSFNALLTISLLDLYVVCKRLVTSQSEWEKVFFIKQGYLIIYETIKAYNSHNHKIKQLVDSKYSALKEQYSDNSASLKKFKNDYSYQDSMKNIRHNIAGHISKDFVTYYDTILSIKGESDVQAILSFVSILKKMENLSFEMERLSQKEAMEELEKEGMGKTLEEYRVNIDQKLNKLRLQIEEKIRENIQFSKEGEASYKNPEEGFKSNV